MSRKFGLHRVGNTPLQKVIAKLDVAFGRMIRVRDAQLGCITCGRTDVPMDAGHFIRREKMSTRFNPANVNGQCRKENRFEGGRTYEYGLALDRKYLKGTAARLFKESQKIKQWDVKTLSSLRTQPAKGQPFITKPTNPSYPFDDPPEQTEAQRLRRRRERHLSRLQASLVRPFRAERVRFLYQAEPDLQHQEAERAALWVR
jgi:hypothetical protein